MTIQELEIQRQDLIKTVKSLKLFVIPLVIFWLYLIFVWNNFLTTLMFPSICGVLLYGVFSNKYSVFRSNFRKNIVPNIIQNLSSDTYSDTSSNPSFDMHGFVNKSIFEASRIFKPDYTTYTGEDLLTYSDFGNLQISELLVQKITHHKDHSGKETTETKQYFKGLFGVANFPFTFEGTTVLYAKNNFYRGFEAQKVKLESTRFMEIFDVVSDSQIGSRLALQTDIMNNLLYLKDNLKTTFSFSFVGNRIFFAIDYSSFLEPNWRLAVDSQPQILKIQQDLGIIKHTIDTFKLRQNHT